MACCLSSCSWEAPKHRLNSCGSGPWLLCVCGIFPDQRLNLYLLHWQANSLPLGHQKSPGNTNFITEVATLKLNVVVRSINLRVPLPLTPKALGRTIENCLCAPPEALRTSNHICLCIFIIHTVLHSSFSNNVCLISLKSSTSASTPTFFIGCIVFHHLNGPWLIYPASYSWVFWHFTGFCCCGCCCKEHACTGIFTGLVQIYLSVE